MFHVVILQSYIITASPARVLPDTLCLYMFYSLRQKYLAGLSKNTVLLACASLFADISTEMLYPILPVYLTQTLKAGGSVVGIIEGIAVATQSIIQGFSGWLSDRLQKRKPVAFAGYIVAAIAKPLVGFASAWQGVLGARFLDRIGTGTWRTCSTRQRAVGPTRRRTSTAPGSGRATDRR